MDAAETGGAISAVSPLSQLPHLDEAIISAMPGESDRKFLSSLSQRKKRRDRRRLPAFRPDSGGIGGGAAADAAVAAADPLLTAAAAMEEGALDAPPPPPPDFVEGGDEAAASAAQQPEAAEAEEAVELVQDQMDALPAMVAHMEGRRVERQNLQYRMRTIVAKVPARKRLSQSARRLWQSFADLLSYAFDAFTLGLYRTSFARIEGRFGAGCASYFSFIRWLFMFNLALACLVFASCVFPYMLVCPGARFNDTVPAGVALDDQPHVAMAVQCSHMLDRRIANLSVGDGVGVWAARVTDVFTGGGWMLTHTIFLGSFFNKSMVSVGGNATIESSCPQFNTPVAMLLCLIALLACGVGAALSTSNSLYRQVQKVSVRGSKAGKLSAELFTTWDYGLRAQKAARLRRRTIAKRLRSLVLHLQLKARSRSPGTLAARVLANLATAGLYCAAAYLIYFTTEVQTRLNEKTGNRRDMSTVLRLAIDLLPQLTISLINVLVPMVLGKLIVFEYYSASMEILVQLTRVVFLKLLSFVTLIVTIGFVVQFGVRDDCGEWEKFETMCWETYVGQQLYRTLLTDVVICLLVTPTLDTLRWLLSVKVGGRLFSKVPLSELLISNEVLTLVYQQSVCFIGAFFCPYLLPIACLSYGCLFHIKRFTLRFMRVSNKSFRATGLERFFLDVLLLFLFVLLMPLALCVLNFHPSKGCGPYRIYQSAAADYHMTSSLTNWIMWSGSGSDSVRDKFLDFVKLVYTYTVLNTTTHLLIFLLLLVFTYFFYSVVKARDTLIEFLERKLQSESKVKLELANRELQLLKMRQ